LSAVVRAQFIGRLSGGFVGGRFREFAGIVAWYPSLTWRLLTKQVEGDQTF
jgi:hypothetical protein